MPTDLTSGLTLEELRTILDAARASGWKPSSGGGRQREPQAHVVSTVTHDCTRCGADQRARELDEDCDPQNPVGAYTRAQDARVRALGRPSEPLPLREVTSRPMPDVRPVRVYDMPGRIGPGRTCVYGCDGNAVSARCEWHAPRA